MDYESFTNEFFLDLRNNNKHALTLLNENKKIIQEYLGKDANPVILDKFVNDLINVVIRTTKKKFSIIKSALNHYTMVTVYDRFKNSDVMIKAVQNDNKYALKWAKSMKVSSCVQDENGMNVLMYTVQNMKWDSFTKSFASDSKCLHQEDNNGRTALFYALRNPSGLWEVVDKGIYINHKDHDGNNVLIYTCKVGILSPIKYFIVDKKVDVNAINNDGKTAAMYLAMRGKYAFADVKGTGEALHASTMGKYSLFQALQNAKCNLNYVNERGESVLSLLLKYMYGPEGTSYGQKKFDSYIRTLISLVFSKCDFNIPVDEDGNTPAMIFLLVNDRNTFEFVMKHREIDLTKKNKYGENVTSIYMKCKFNDLYHNVLNSPTFDYNYIDPINGNNILMISAITEPSYISKILVKKPEFLYEINNKGENALMIACKANNKSSVLSLLNHPVPVNNQDQLGNTALHYAVACKNPIIVHHLIEKGANYQLKNEEGKSAYDLATELGDKNILMALEKKLDQNTIQKNRE